MKETNMIDIQKALKDGAEFKSRYYFALQWYYIFAAIIFIPVLLLLFKIFELFIFFVPFIIFGLIFIVPFISGLILLLKNKIMLDVIDRGQLFSWHDFSQFFLLFIYAPTAFVIEIVTEIPHQFFAYKSVVRSYGKLSLLYVADKHINPIKAYHIVKSKITKEEAYVMRLFDDFTFACIYRQLESLAK